MPKPQTKRISRAPKLPSGDDYYLAWDAYDSADDIGFIEEPEPVVEDDPAYPILFPLLQKYGHMKECEIELLHALWKVAHVRGGSSFPQWLGHAGIINQLTANILESPARDVCNLECVFHKLRSDGMLKLPGLVECFLDRVQEEAIREEFNNGPMESGD